MSHRFGPSEYVGWLDVDKGPPTEKAAKLRWGQKLENIHVPPPTADDRLAAVRYLLGRGLPDVAEALGLAEELRRVRAEAVAAYISEGLTT